MAAGRSGNRGGGARGNVRSLEGTPGGGQSLASAGGATRSGIRGWPCGDHERVRAWGSEPRPAVAQVSDPPVHWRQQATWGVRGPTETFQFSRNEVRTERAQLQSSLTLTSTKHRRCRFITSSFLGPSSSRSPSAFVYQDSVVFSHSVNSCSLRKWLGRGEHINHRVQ